MSEIRVNNIINRTGISGPEIAGIPVVDSTSYFVPPSGRTGQRYADEGENIVRDGLVLYLDAKYSYPSTTGITTTTASLDPDVYTWYDMSGNENHGELKNGVSYSGTGGGSLVFDGVNDYVAFTNDNILPSAGLTLSTWVKTSVADKWIIDKSAGGIATGYLLAFTSAGFIAFYINSSSVTTSISAANGVWHNIQATWTSSTSLILYQNGVQMASNTTSVPSSIINPSFNLQIGRRGAGIDLWNGNIAQVSIYNRALTASEVLQNYNATKSRFGL